MNLLDAKSIIVDLGLLGILGALFAETGLLIGLILPGDSLLFVAGLAASGSAAALLGGTHLSVLGLFIGAPLATILGSQLGHYIGHRFGRPLFDRPDGRFFNHSRVVATEKWLKKYGPGRAIVLARYVPFVRTLINPLCGIVRVPASKFLLWNVIGGIIWADGIALLGYLLGEKLKGSIDSYLLPIIGVIILLSLLPLGLEIIREIRTRRHLS
ncbi:MAG TPA: DedA family protein [Candidatus Paceibacterota bacterium]|nr:DedA family protein [Candidatus Paceibacterota bacterium]